MAVVMSDTITAATAATLMKGVSMVRKNNGSPLEKHGARFDDDRFQLRHADGGLLFFGQPVLRAC